MNLTVTQRGFYHMLVRCYDEILPPLRRTEFYRMPGCQDYYLEWRNAAKDRCTAALMLLGDKVLLTIRCADSRRCTYWPGEEILRQCGMIGEEERKCR